jgi:hypothetical protein
MTSRGGVTVQIGGKWLSPVIGLFALDEDFVIRNTCVISFPPSAMRPVGILGPEVKLITPGEVILHGPLSWFGSVVGALETLSFKVGDIYITPRPMDTCASEPTRVQYEGDGERPGR